MRSRVRSRFASVRLAAGVAAGLAGGLTAHGMVQARETLPGPVPAAVLRVIDGDTLRVRARIWLGQVLEVNVRIAGIDAPERNGRCPAERDRAVQATAFLRRVVADGAVALREIRYGRYAGRVLAAVTVADGRDAGTALIGAGLARAYDGGRRASWCPEAEAARP